MAQQQGGRFRRFLQTTLGKILIILVTFGVVLACLTVVNSVILAIPAFLVFGLAIPIWSGLKRPRFLALVGLVVVVAVAPVANVYFTQELLAPVGPSASNSGGLYSSPNGPLMQNASVTPFTGTTGTTFTWAVTVFPQNHPVGNTTPVELDLYISTCPGATGNSSPYCSAGYPLYVLKNTSLPQGPNVTQYTVTFHYRIGSDGVWTWQMGIYTNNSTTKKPYYQLLAGDPAYNGIEGPVIGGFWVIYGDILGSVYLEDLLLLGAPFFLVLLIYMIFKNRERRRKEAQERALGPVPAAESTGAPSPAAGAGQAPLPSGPSGPPSQGATAAAPSATDELNCPKCNAVVYRGETTCWKCGAALPASATTPA